MNLNKLVALLCVSVVFPILASVALAAESKGHGGSSANTKTGEQRHVPAQAISDKKQKKISEPSVAVAPWSQKRDSCGDGPDGRWCRALLENRR